MSVGKKTHWLRATICVLLACGIAGVALAAVLFNANPDKTYVSLNIQFTFSGAADGLAPNGYVFNVEDIRSEALVRKALTAAGLADRYTADQIQPMISVNGSYPDNILDQLTSHTSLLDPDNNQTVSASNYHPTVYTISISRDFDNGISRADLENLLSCLVSAYKEYFAQTSAMGVSAARIDQDISGYDYPQMLSALSVQMEQTADYAEKMSEKAPTLSVDRQTFGDVGIMLDNLVNTNIARLNGLISAHALTKDAARLRAVYEYEIQDRSIQLEKKKEQLKNLENLIGAYQKSVAYVTTSEELLRVKTNSPETYDKLIEEKNQVSEEISVLSAEIAGYQSRLDDLLAGQAGMEAVSAELEASDSAAISEGADASANLDESATEIEAAETVAEGIKNQNTEDSSDRLTALESGISTLRARQKTITDQFNTLIRAYNDREINDSTVSVSSIRYYTPSLLSGTFAVRAVKTVGPLCVLGLIVCLALIIISRSKEQKSIQKT